MPARRLRNVGQRGEMEGDMRGGDICAAHLRRGEMLHNSQNCTRPRDKKHEWVQDGSFIMYQLSFIIC